MVGSMHQDCINRVVRGRQNNFGIPVLLPIERGISREGKINILNVSHCSNND